MSLAEEDQRTSAPSSRPLAAPQRTSARATPPSPHAAEDAGSAAPLDPEAAVAAPARPRKPRSKRKVALGLVSIVVLLAGLAYGLYYWLVLSHYESTDNAYVQGNVVQLTPQVAGTVVGIYADDTDFVKAGQLLVKLDPADAQVAL